MSIKRIISWYINNMNSTYPVNWSALITSISILTYYKRGYEICKTLFMPEGNMKRGN